MTALHYCSEKRTHVVPYLQVAIFFAYWLLLCIYSASLFSRLQIERICSEKVVEIEKRDKEIVDAIERLTLFEEQLQESEV